MHTPGTQLKKENSKIIYAVGITALSTSIIFALGVWIFGYSSIWHPISIVPTPAPITIDIPLVPADTGTTDTRVCTQEYAPICGIDGQTYSNDCMAGDIAVAHIGSCEVSMMTGTSMTGETNMAGGDPIVATDYSNTGSYFVYTNPGIGYGYSMPRYVHYQGMGARDGAIHSMAIGLSASGISTYDTAEIQVLFFKKIPPNYLSTYADHDTRTRTLSGGTIVVDTIGDNPRLTEIVDTIIASAR